MHWLGRSAQRDPKLFVLWQLGVKPEAGRWEPDEARASRPFCEGGGVQLPSATRLVVMCDTKAACEQAEQQVRVVLTRLGLEPHPDKMRQVDLSPGRNGLCLT
ncbi:hypothetical protein BH23BAC4_BH23BAC4_12280 [soil metagenome]